VLTVAPAEPARAWRPSLPGPCAPGQPAGPGRGQWPRRVGRRGQGEGARRPGRRERRPGPRRRDDI